MAIRLPAPQRRRQLLDVALDRFAAGGFEGTSMDDIAAGAGVTKPVLYQHFASKRALYLELLDDVGSRLLETIAEATALATGPRAQVQAGFGAYFRFVADHRNAFVLLFGDGPRRDAEFAAAVHRVEDAIADAVAVLIEADLDDDHRRLLARSIVGMAEGAGRDWLASSGLAQHHGTDRPEVMARRIAELAWGGLRNVRRD